MLAKDGGNQSDVVVSFKRPAMAVNLTVSIVGANQKLLSAYAVHYYPPSPSSSAQDGDRDGGGGGSSSSSSSVSINGGHPVALRLSPLDKTIDVRVFVDNVLSEVYFMNGRVVETLPSTVPDGASITITADQPGVTLASATAWVVQSIWISTDAVLNTARTDGGDQSTMVKRIHDQQR